MSKRTKIILGVIAVVIVAAIIGVLALGASGQGPQVETAEVVEKELAVTVTASGRIEAGVSADVFPPATGTLDKVFVSDGASVTAGTKLAIMDTGPLELQVAQARAALSSAKAQLAGVEQQGTTQADITAARAAVTATKQQYEAARVALANVSDSAPSRAQIEAAEAATNAGARVYANAYDAWQAAREFSPSPSVDPTVAAAAAARDQAYAGYLGAVATEKQLKSTDLSTARAQARAARDQAFAAWKNAEAQLGRLSRTDTGAQRRAAEAAIAQGAEAVAVAEEALKKATLVAPIDGVVVFNGGGASAAAAGAGLAAAGGASASSGDPAKGSAVTPGVAPFTVVDLGALKFAAEVDESDVEVVRVGMKALVTLDAFPGTEFNTTVTRINPVAQATATGGTVFVLEMKLADTAKNVLIGMKGDATVEVSSRGSAMTVPVEALFSEGATDYVYVVQDGKLKKIEITVGETTDTEVEVLSGLDVGDVVALSGSTQYTDGMPVRVKP